MRVCVCGHQRGKFGTEHNPWKNPKTNLDSVVNIWFNPSTCRIGSSVSNSSDVVSNIEDMMDWI